MNTNTSPKRPLQEGDLVDDGEHLQLVTQVRTDWVGTAAETTDKYEPWGYTPEEAATKLSFVGDKHSQEAKQFALRCLSQSPLEIWGSRRDDLIECQLDIRDVIA